jgi:hypothetical protein
VHVETVDAQDVLLSVDGIDVIDGVERLADERQS